ncbi:hypothetical protein [Aridibaculum aurantiacum]|uniref:hypothetical protein n=1 Tax=Aridibaculum aurantiacum TaxID=2810307 RepID=UPI001A965710|nr:hypothetical protein [Aridibaculum aurantiacum]
MRLSLVVLVSFISLASFAQVDDVPDYRSKRELFTRIQEKDIRSDVSTFSMGGIDEGVGKLPLQTIPVAETGDNFITFKGENIKVTITTAPFDATKHKLGYYDNKHLVKIDNKAFFGDYGKVPRTKIQDVTVIIDKDTIAIPPAAWGDLYNPILYVNDRGTNKTNNKVLLSKDGRKVYVYMLKQESGGSYEVTWIIQDKKYLKRVVDFGFLK